MEYFYIKGNKSGKTSIILAGVHGNEPCGIEAFSQIIPTLAIEHGEVYFLIGNPKALESNIRFIDENLNRLFKKEVLESPPNTYERSCAQRIIPYLQKADALLDIHASNTPESIPFIIAEPNSIEVTSALPIETIVSGFDELEPGGTDGFMNSLGKIGICVECGYTKDPRTTEVAKESILSFLSSMAHITAKPTTRKTKVTYQMETLYHTKTNSFVLTKEFADFEFIPKGTHIATDGNEKVFSEKDGCILFARNRTAIDAEGFLFGVKK